MTNEEAIEFIRIEISRLWKTPQNLIYKEALEKAIEALSEQKTGHWVSDGIQGEIDGQIIKAFSCSECGAISVFRIAGDKILNGDLCPNCGAKME